MFVKSLAAVAALASAVAAQTPANMSMCDYYTTALFTNNTGTNQLTLLTALVNTAVIGNYTTPNKNAVTGILNPGTYNGTAVNLLPYFNGGLASSNRGGSSGVAINFLDGGGAAPLKQNMAATSENSNQYMLLTHLYQYFGALLGCSASGFPAYAGQASQYNVHKFMDLNPAQVGYFITQVGAAATSFGVGTADVTKVAQALETFFDVRCAPATTIIPSQGPQLQSICIDSTCPLAVNATCDAYNGTATPPAVANSTLAGNSSTGSGSSTASGTATGTSSTSTSSVTASGAGAVGFSFVAIAAGVFAAFL